MKIAILGVKGVPGKHGVEVVVDSLVPYLVALGHEVTIYAYEFYSKPNDNYQGAKVVTVSGSKNKNLEMITHMWKASWHVRRSFFDIIHIHSSDPCLLAWIPRAEFGIVATSHGQAYLRKKWSLPAKYMSRVAERFFIWLPDEVTSVSKPLALFYQHKYDRKVHYIPNGIKLREIPSMSWLERWDLKPRSYIFCSAGRMERTKGVHTLINAYKLLKTDLELIIVGGGIGSDMEYLQELKKDCPIGVRFLGFIHGDEYFSLLSHAKIFVFPSEYEAMSMALLEGLSMGVPTVYSNIPENESVAHGIGNAFIVSNSESLASSITQVLTEYDMSLELGLKAKEVIAKKHDWSVIAKQYNELYNIIVQKKS